MRLELVFSEQLQGTSYSAVTSSERQEQRREGEQKRMVRLVFDDAPMASRVVRKGQEERHEDGKAQEEEVKEKTSDSLCYTRSESSLGTDTGTGTLLLGEGLLDRTWPSSPSLHRPPSRPTTEAATREGESRGERYDSDFETED